MATMEYRTKVRYRTIWSSRFFWGGGGGVGAGLKEVY